MNWLISSTCVAGVSCALDLDLISMWAVFWYGWSTQSLLSLSTTHCRMCTYCKTSSNSVMFFCVPCVANSTLLIYCAHIHHVRGLLQMLNDKQSCRFTKALENTECLFDQMTKPSLAMTCYPKIFPTASSEKAIIFAWLPFPLWLCLTPY